MPGARLIDACTTRLPATGASQAITGVPASSSSTCTGDGRLLSVSVGIGSIAASPSSRGALNVPPAGRVAASTW